MSISEKICKKLRGFAATIVIITGFCNFFYKIRLFWNTNPQFPHDFWRYYCILSNDLLTKIYGNVNKNLRKQQKTPLKLIRRVVNMDVNNFIERSLERDALKYHEELNF